jgi:hypothetical protein
MALLMAIYLSLRLLGYVGCWLVARLPVLYQPAPCTHRMTCGFLDALAGATHVIIVVKGYYYLLLDDNVEFGGVLTNSD